MSHERDDAEWLKRGRQRAAVAQVLKKPMTGTEICAAARASNPRIQLRDVWFLMRQFQERNLVVCFNPRLVTGRLCSLTDTGRRSVAKAFGIVLEPTPTEVDWRKYSWVARARIRRLTLLGLAELESKTKDAQTATSIRKHLRNEHPVGLDLVVRALKELLSLGLVRESGVAQKRGCKLYRVTRAGQRIVEQLKR